MSIFAPRSLADSFQKRSHTLRSVARLFPLLILLVLPCLVMPARGVIVRTASGTWATVGNLMESRSGGSSTLLPDGSVLIAGGETGDAASRDAELFTPAGEIVRTGSMQAARYGHQAVLLSTGKVLVLGGIGEEAATLASAEIYDPASGSWVSAGSMGSPRSEFAAAQLRDGRVVVAGGTSGPAPLDSLDLFDPADGSLIVSSARLGTRRSAPSATTLLDGRVLIAGGSDEAGPLSTTEIYDPSTDSISAGPDLAFPRSAHSATRLLDGSILLAGGSDGLREIHSAEIVDARATRVSTVPGGLATGRSGHLAVLLPRNNAVLIAGGVSAGEAVSSCEVYLPVRNEFVGAEAMHVARSTAFASPLAEDGILIAGGGSADAALETYSFATVKTDHDDYAPESIVTISGTGWEPGETVNFWLKEEPETHEDHYWSTVADENGAILDMSFSPEWHDQGVRFYLSATGSVSEAQATFTDGTPTRIQASSMSPASGGCLSTITARATLEFKTGPANSPFAPLPDKTIVFTLGSSTASGVTDASGVATASLIVPAVATSLTASFAGDSTYNNTASSISFSVTGTCDDSTPPVITPSVTGAVGANGWYVGNVSVGWIVTDPNSAVTSTSGCGAASVSTDTTGTTFTCSATSAGGSSSNSVTIKRDATPPTALLSVSGTPGAHGWYVSNVTVTTTGTDAMSGPVSCTSVQQQNSETAGATFNGSCTNGAGLTTNAAPMTVKVDKSGPSAAMSVTSGTPGSNGWYVSDVTIATSGSDAVSGPVSCSADQHQSDETTGATFSGSCTNDAGLSTDAAPMTVKVDKSGPSAAMSVTSGTPGSNGWYVSDVTIATSGSDAVSGPVSCSADQHQSDETTGATFSGSCTNDAGLSTDAAPMTVKVDKSGPSAAMSVTSGTPGSNGWYVSDVTIATSGSDAVSGPVSCSADQHQSDETTGATFSGSCTNDAGLSTDASPMTVKVDKTGPSAAMSVSSGTPGSNGWYVSDVTVSTSGSDSISGPPACTSPQTLSSDTSGTSVTGSCVNQAGLSTDAAPLTIKLDKTAPTISIISPGAGPYLLNAAVSSSYSCSDAMSGVSSCTGPAPSGSSLSTSTVGSKSFSVTATDQAGNQATSSRSYAIQYASLGACLDSAGHMIMQPINSDGTSVFKQKSTVPAKFRVCDARGASIGDAGVVTSFRLIQKSTGIVTEVDEAVVSTTPDEAFRWDSVGQQWIFNMATKNLTANSTYFYRVTLNDLTTIDFNFGLK